MKTLASDYIATCTKAELGRLDQNAALNGLSREQMAAINILMGYKSVQECREIKPILADKTAAMDALDRVAALEWIDEDGPETAGRIINTIIAPHLPWMIGAKQPIVR